MQPLARTGGGMRSPRHPPTGRSASPACLIATLAASLMPCSVYASLSPSQPPTSAAQRAQVAWSAAAVSATHRTGEHDTAPLLDWAMTELEAGRPPTEIRNTINSARTAYANRGCAQFSDLAAQLLCGR